MARKTYVQEGFSVLLPPLADFTVNGMKRAYGTGWKYEVAKILGEVSPKFDDDDEIFKRRLGVGACLKLLHREENVFHDALGEEGTDLCKKLTVFLNALAHAGQEDFDEEYALRALRVLSELSEIVGSDRTGEILSLSDSMQKEDEDCGIAVTLGMAEQGVQKKGSPRFDRYESAVLLDAYIKVRETRMTREAAVKEVSEKLRAMAVKAGKEITEDFRSVVGISMQINFMEASFEGTKYMGREPSEVFLKTVDTYKTNPQGFAEILDEALERCGCAKEETVSPSADTGADATSKAARTANFNIFEASILLDECVRVMEYGKDRKKAVKSVSDKLRKRAKNLGMSVTENYRSTKEIDSRMRAMSNTIRHAVSSGSKVPEVYKEIVELYSSKRREYDRILRMALESCE